METLFLMMYIMASGVFCADQIGPDQDTEDFHNEGQTVTLKCSYDSSSQYVDLYWYRQYPNKAPQYLLYKPARSSSSRGHISNPRFSSVTSDRSTQLTISGVTLADTALYYCALERVGYTWSTADPLIFGKPISLHVKPNRQDTVPPVLSILSPSQSSNGPKVCLAARFRPIDGFMKLTLDGKEKEVELNPSSAVLSKEGLFYYAGFSEDNIQKCQMNDQEKNTYSKGNEGVSPTCEPTVNTTSNQTKEIIDKPKENTLSLIVTGLRLLLAKAVAVNVMITFKAFFV